MLRATFRFYQELNDFLPPQRCKVAFDYAWKSTASIKHLIEALGVPHTEVDLILVNGESVDFAYQPQDGDRISVYPVFESLDISPLVRLRPQPLRETRFVLDGHLSRLAAYLRMLGFDTLWQIDWDDATLADLSHDQQRILLTRDRGLLKRSAVARGYWVRSTAPREQLREVLERFDLQRGVRPFTRCLACNGALHSVSFEAIKAHLLPDTARYYREFWQCEHCGKVYWQGSHYRRMLKLIQEVNSS